MASGTCLVDFIAAMKPNNRPGSLQCLRICNAWATWPTLCKSNSLQAAAAAAAAHRHSRQLHGLDLSGHEAGGDERLQHLQQARNGSSTLC